LGATLIGDLWATEQVIDSITNALVITNAVKFPGKEFTTVSETDVATPLDIAFNITKPQMSLLLNINSFVLPTGLSIDYLFVSSDIPTTKFAKSINLYADTDGVSFPLNISAVDPLNLNTINLSVSSTLAPGGSQWYYENKFTKGTSVDITTLIDGVPQITSGQSGDTIKWSPTTGSKIIFQTTNISNSGAKPFESLWALTTLDSSVSEIVLPNIPSTVTPILTAGINYDIQVLTFSSDNSSLASQKTNKIFSNLQHNFARRLISEQSKSQGIAILNNYSEYISSEKVSWTR